jgi:ubiquinone biosynthesis protein Coq4
MKKEVLTLRYDDNNINENVVFNHRTERNIAIYWDKALHEPISKMTTFITTAVRASNAI